MPPEVLHPRHPVTPRFQLLIAVGVALAVIGAVVLLALPVKTAGFSGTIVTLPNDCQYGCGDVLYSATVPEGAQVALRWVDTSGGTVSFEVQDPVHAAVSFCYSASATNGSCAFVSTGGLYYFAAQNSGTTSASQIVDYSGTYHAPLA